MKILKLKRISDSVVRVEFEEYHFFVRRVNYRDANVWATNFKGEPTGWKWMDTGEYIVTINNSLTTFLGMNVEEYTLNK